MKLKTGLGVSSRKGGESRHELENLKGLEELEARRLLFEAGNKWALFEALALCAHFQAVMPDWLADALLDSERRIESGEIGGIADIFGGPADNKAQRRAKTRYRAIEGNVIHRLGLERAQGKSFNIDVCFDKIKDDLGCGRRDVEKVYRTHKQVLAAIEKVGAGATFSSVHASLSFEEFLPRRYGRAIIE